MNRGLPGGRSSLTRICPGRASTGRSTWRQNWANPPELPPRRRLWARLGEDIGLQFRFDLIERVPNSRRSHLLIAHASRHGRQGRMKDRIMQAYFQEGVDIGELEELVRLGLDAGLSERECRAALVLREGQDGVVAAERHAAALGINAVPTFIFDGQYTSRRGPGARQSGAHPGPGRRLCGGARNGVLNPLELTGRARTHVLPWGQGGAMLHAHALLPFTHLCRVARAAGIRYPTRQQFSRFRAAARPLEWEVQRHQAVV